MIFGDPYRFAIWVEYIPSWSLHNNSFYNGLFHYIIDGKMFPEILRTSTLNVDINMLTDVANALVSQPKCDSLFLLTAEEAFRKLYQLNYPESTIENEYPMQDFTYNATTEILSDDGVNVFAIANYANVRILIAKTQTLVKNKGNDNFHWEDKCNIEVKDVIISKTELNTILETVKNYYVSISY